MKLTLSPLFEGFQNIYIIFKESGGVGNRKKARVVLGSSNEKNRKRMIPDMKSTKAITTPHIFVHNCFITI